MQDEPVVRVEFGEAGAHVQIAAHAQMKNQESIVQGGEEEFPPTAEIPDAFPCEISGELLRGR